MHYKSLLKTFFITFLVAFTFSYANAQDYSVEWGPEYKKPGGVFSDFKFLGIHGDFYYLIAQTRKDIILLTYTMDHKLVKKKELDFRLRNSRFEVRDIITTKDGPFIYMHYYREKEKEWSVYVSKFENGKFSNPEEVFYETFDVPRSRLTTAFRQFDNRISTQKDLVLSHDSSYVAFVNVIPSQDFRKDDVISVVVWDSKMNIQWKAYFDFKFGDRNYNVKEAIVSNSGEVYFLASVDKRFDLNGKPMKIKEKHLPRYVYNLYKLTEDEIVESYIDIGKDKAVVEAGLFIENEETGQILLGGFYTTNEPKSRMKGVFFTSGNSDLELGKANTHEFEKEFMEGLTSNRSIRKNKGLDFSYDIKNLLRFDNGSMGFIAENNYVSTNINQSNFGGPGAIANPNFQNTVTYHSLDIIIPRFNTEGELLSIEKIDKGYSSDYPLFTSYAYAAVDNKTYLIFNDRKRWKESRKLKMKGRLYTDMVVIGADGMVEFNETIFTDRDSELPFMPSISDFSNDYFIIGGSRGKKFTFGTINLK